MIVECPSMSVYRDLCSIGPFVRAYQTMGPKYSSVRIYAMFMDDKDMKKVQKKALALYSMKIGWLKEMKIPLISK